MRVKTPVDPKKKRRRRRIPAEDNGEQCAQKKLDTHIYIYTLVFDFLGASLL